MDKTNIYMLYICYIVANWQKPQARIYGNLPATPHVRRDVNRSKLMVSRTSQPVYGLLGRRALCGVHIKEG